MKILFSIVLFVLAGLCEIGGGYLIWQWLREGKAWWMGLSGAVILVLYGIIATWQPGHLWKGICSLRWDFYNAGHHLGLESRWHHS